MEIATGALLLAAWLVALNIAAYAVMAGDKRKAQKRKRRVPERTLFLLAAIGGALGIWTAMSTKRHKTQHNSFRFGVPLLLLVNIAVYGYLFTLL
ncbi:DUF1294 domain-containing protein [Saccharibacillus sp. CPCC 101409]|uniref:DUF1294 domain-containing protein n=1 Tax=Saccharibacillus sp. CPCC 101409 TaxID=3058041 RepID=UPI0026733BDA|nr:DUF1294 domain-containing protein [Saccharibacillus sp. CPCC 101409]MDO3413208.1 DUF1294 domain-containing protein [Saccharibacillus sp. CPCC 101409]